MNAVSILIVTSALGIDFGTAGTVHTHTSVTREVVDEWATRPRIDVIPFADRDRSNAIARRPITTGDLRTGGDARGPWDTRATDPRSNDLRSSDLTSNRRRLDDLDYPPSFDHAGSSRTGSFGGTRSSTPAWSGGNAQLPRNLPPPPDSDWRSSPSVSSSRGNSSNRWPPRDDYPDDPPDRNIARRDRAERWSNSSQLGDSPRPFSPPTASIVETKRDAPIEPANRRPIAQTSSSVTIISLFLFMSIGGNLYLGWLARDFYWRYRDMAWEVRNQPSTHHESAE